MSNNGTPMPSPYQTIFDTNGDPVSGGLVWTYISGTSTPLSTWTTAALSVANTNPIVADSAGRFVAFLSPGSSYKFVYETAATPPAHGTIIRTVDLVSAVPSSSANLDITGTAGESLALGSAVYLSDGSGGKTVGNWYLADSGTAYSSSSALVVGMTVAAISSAASGTIRILGQVPGLTVVAGSTYYIGTAGAITITPPPNARLLGIADTSTSLVLSTTTSTTSLDLLQIEAFLSLLLMFGSSAYFLTAGVI